MRFNLSVGAAGEDSRRKRPPFKRLITKREYVNFIQSSDINELIKERLIEMANKVPSATLTYVVKNLHVYIARVASQINAEKNKELEERRLYESQTHFGDDGCCGIEQTHTGVEAGKTEKEEEETIPVIVGYEATSDDGGGEVEGGGTDVPPTEGNVTCSLANSEHPSGCSEPEDTDSAPSSGSDDRLRTDDGSTSGVSGKDKRPRRTRK